MTDNTNKSMIEVPITGGGDRTIASDEIESTQQQKGVRRTIVLMKSKAHHFVDLADHEIQSLIFRAKRSKNGRATYKDGITPSETEQAKANVETGPLPSIGSSDAARDASREDTKTEAQQAAEPIPVGDKAIIEPLPGNTVPVEEPLIPSPGTVGVNEFEPGRGPGETTRVTATEANAQPIATPAPAPSPAPSPEEQEQK